MLRETLHKAGLEDDVVMASSPAPSEAAQMWSQPLGLLFIDGGHTDEQAQADYESWALHVARHGALAINPRRVPRSGRRRPGAVPRLPPRLLSDGFRIERRQQGSLTRILERP